MPFPSKANILIWGFILKGVIEWSLSRASDWSGETRRIQWQALQKEPAFPCLAPRGSARQTALLPFMCCPVYHAHVFADLLSWNASPLLRPPLPPPSPLMKSFQLNWPILSPLSPWMSGYSHLPQTAQYNFLANLTILFSYFLPVAPLSVALGKELYPCNPWLPSVVIPTGGNVFRITLDYKIYSLQSSWE